MLINPATNSYERTFVPESLATVTHEHLDTVGSALELGAAWFEGRGQEMNGHWAHIDPRHCVTEIQRGYRPVRPSNAPELKNLLGLQVMNHPQHGEVYAYGDLFLTEYPKDLHEARRAREEATIKRDRARGQADFQADLNDKLNYIGGEGSRVLSDQSYARTSRERQGDYDTPDELGEMARLEAEAAFDYEAQKNAGYERRVFAGVGEGTMQKNHGYQPRE